MSGAGFRDRFGAAAPAYAAFRPRYPPELFAALAAAAPRRERAWDCATGTGQAAVGLAARFPHVVATDASERQLAAAERHPRVTYVRARAEASGIASGGVDVVTVAQALHWLDRPRFFEEVRRVLVPRGVFAAWCYETTEIEPGIDAIVREFYGVTVGPYWAPERALVEDGYRSLELPFEEFAVPVTRMEADFDLDGFLGYLGTWSATLRCRALTGVDPLPGLRARMLPAWGVPATPRRVRWPLSVRAGRTAR